VRGLSCAAISLERADVGEVGGDPGGAKCVASNFSGDTGRHGAAADHARDHKADKLSDRAMNSPAGSAVPPLFRGEEYVFDERFVLGVDVRQPRVRRNADISIVHADLFLPRSNQSKEDRDNGVHDPSELRQEFSS